jgi:hypothetical protein
LGNPDAEIWFVGLEEGGAEISETEIDDKVKDCQRFPYYLTSEEIKPFHTPVWDYISKLVIKYFELKNYSWQEYREVMFSENVSTFFLTELFPLPKKKFNYWASGYGEIFGLSNNDYEEYVSEVRSKRFPLIYNLWLERKPKHTICFGKSGWDYFIEVFGLKDDKCKSELNSKYYESKKIILTPFFGNGQMSNELIDNIVLLLKNG